MLLHVVFELTELGVVGSGEEGDAGGSVAVGLVKSLDEILALDVGSHHAAIEFAAAAESFHALVDGASYPFGTFIIESVVDHGEVGVEVPVAPVLTNHALGHRGAGEHS